jgi:hypothetical protein
MQEYNINEGINVDLKEKKKTFSTRNKLIKFKILLQTGQELQLGVKNKNENLNQ